MSLRSDAGACLMPLIKRCSAGPVMLEEEKLKVPRCVRGPVIFVVRGFFARTRSREGGRDPVTCCWTTFSLLHTWTLPNNSFPTWPESLPLDFAQVSSSSLPISTISPLHLILATFFAVKHSLMDSLPLLKWGNTSLADLIFTSIPFLPFIHLFISRLAIIESCNLRPSSLSMSLLKPYLSPTNISFHLSELNIFKDRFLLFSVVNLSL